MTTSLIGCEMCEYIEFKYDHCDNDDKKKLLADNIVKCNCEINVFDIAASQCGVGSVDYTDLILDNGYIEAIVFNLKYKDEVISLKMDISKYVYSRYGLHKDTTTAATRVAKFCGSFNVAELIEENLEYRSLLSSVPPDIYIGLEFKSYIDLQYGNLHSKVISTYSDGFSTIFELLDIGYIPKLCIHKANDTPTLHVTDMTHVSKVTLDEYAQIEYDAKHYNVISINCSQDQWTLTLTKCK